MFRKIISCAMVLMALQFSVLQAQMNFRDLSLQQSIEKAASEHKPVMLMCYAAWCTHCEKMLDEVFPDTALGNYYNANFICIKQDISIGEGPQLAKRFSISSFPTFAILNAKGETIYQTVGEMKADDFIAMGKTALIPENQTPYLKTQFEKDPADSVACYKYLTALSRARIPAQSIADTYLEAHKNNFEFSLANWKIFNLSISDMQSEPFRFILAHKKEFSDAVTEVRVNRKIFKTAAYNLQIPVSANDTVNYFRQKKIAAALQLYSVDSIIFVSDLNLYERNKHITAYTETAIAGAEKYFWNDYVQLRHIADIIFHTSSDMEATMKAAAFAERSSAIKPEYGNTLLAAKMYLKAGDKEKARVSAEAAKAIAEKFQMNTSEVTMLIQQCIN